MVTVVDIQGGQAKLGFEFPEGTKVLRHELFLKIQQQNAAASKAAAVIGNMIEKPQPPKKRVKG